MDAIFIAAGAQKTLKYMINTCREHDIDNIYMMQDVAGKEKLPLFVDGMLDETRIRKLRFSKENPSPICKYCDVDNMEEFDGDYSGGKSEIKDFLLNTNK